MSGIRTATALLLASAIIAAATSCGSDANSSAKSKAPDPMKIDHIQYEGGDGSSMEQAVVIKSANGEAEGVAAERMWIQKVHPDWKKSAQRLVYPIKSDSNRRYDLIDYITLDGETRTIFFDITDFFGK